MGLKPKKTAGRKRCRPVKYASLTSFLFPYAKAVKRYHPY